MVAAPRDRLLRRTERPGLLACLPVLSEGERCSFVVLGNTFLIGNLHNKNNSIPPSGGGGYPPVLSLQHPY